MASILDFETIKGLFMIVIIIFLVSGRGFKILANMIRKYAES